MFASIHIPNPQVSAKDVLVDCANAFSPQVEITDERTVVFTIDGLGHLYEGTKDLARAIRRRVADNKLSANIAIATNAETAIIAARNFPGLTLLVPGEVSSAIANLDVNNLPLTQEMAETLELWGVSTFKELSELPEAGMASRLGTEAVKLQRLARGNLDRPLLISKADVSYEEHIELDHEIELIEPLMFILRHSLDKLCNQLESHGMAAGEVRVQLGLVDGSVHDRSMRLPFPLHKSSSLRKLIRLDLTIHPPPVAITSVGLVLLAAPQRRVQEGLFLPLAPEPEKLELTLARIRSLVGEDNLGVPKLLDTHRPDAVELQPYETLSREKHKGKPASPVCQIAFRYFRPPLQAEVTEQQNRPVSVRARGMRGKVVAVAGPWRTSGDWWRENLWNRDEWDAELSDGTVCRLCHEPGKGWFVEGIYD
jgi:protein ImuB